LRRMSCSLGRIARGHTMSKAVDFLLDTFSLRRPINLLKETASQWSEDKAPQLGAALAYYTVFSLAPLLLLLMSIFSLWVHDKKSVQTTIKDQVAQFAGGSSADVVGDIVETTAKKKQNGVLATIAGVVIALFGASGVFGQLQDSLNTIWGVKAKPGLGIMGYLQARFISFAMVGGVCFMLLVSLSVSVAIKALSGQLNHTVPGATVLSTLLSILLNLVVITALFAMIFKFLPDAKIAWSDVWIGAGLTTVLFIIGKWGLGLYLGSGSAGSAYGAVGSLITTLVWVYYSAQIMLFGAEFTQVYANEFGSHIEPVPHAVRVEKKVVEIPTKQG
jgi:membrane protein